MADIYEDARLYDALGAGHFGGSDLPYWQQQCRHYGGPVRRRPASGYRRAGLGDGDQRL